MPSVIRADGSPTSERPYHHLPLTDYDIQSVVTDHDRQWLHDHSHEITAAKRSAKAAYLALLALRLKATGFNGSPPLIPTVSLA